MDIGICTTLIFFALLEIAPAAELPQEPPAAEAKKAAKEAADSVKKVAGSTSDSVKSAVAGKPSQADIDAAKADGKVWANTSSRIYFKSGPYYGNTKHGRFMTEDEARKAGYRHAKNEGR